MPEILDPPEKPGVPLDQLAHRAEWAETFRPTGNSFASRFRKPIYESDIREYGEALQTQKAAAIEAQARTNQIAQSFFFRDKELDLKRQEQEQDMRFQHELHPLELEAKQESAAAARALAAARVQAARIAAKNDRIKGEHIQGFSGHMNEILDRSPDPDSEDYKLGIVRGIAAFPQGKELAAEYWKATKSPISIDEAVANYKVAQTAAGPGAAVTTTTKGGTTVRTLPPKDQTGKIEEWQEQMLEARTKGDRELEMLFGNRIIAATGGTAATATATVPALTSKAEFDALPRGAEYIRDGKRYRKP